MYEYIVYDIHSVRLFCRHRNFNDKVYKNITQQRRHFENSTADRLASAILQEKYPYKIQKTGLPVLVAFLTSALLVILSHCLTILWLKLQDKSETSRSWTKKWSYLIRAAGGFVHVSLMKTMKIQK